MITHLPVCETCGAVLDPAAPGGLCRRCLLAHAMQPTEPSVGVERHPPPSLEAVQAAFPQLLIIDFVGQGGMGWVFKARQSKLNRLVALKLLPSSLAERDAAFAGRFEREGELLARLHHPNIVAVHDSGSAGEFFYLLMEYVEGVNLRQAMRSSRFTPAQALAIVPHICDALQYAHEEGVLHRDIKPENILLDAKGRVKLADFGIAKLIGAGADLQSGETATGPSSLNLTQSGAMLGTPSYMAPEQRDTPANVDNRADIYSLGVVFYEMLTGELPTGSFVPPSTLSETDPRVDAIVRQALEKERARRQTSAGEVKTQIETISSPYADAPTLPAKDFAEPSLRLCRAAVAGLVWSICAVLSLSIVYWIAEIRNGAEADPSATPSLNYLLAVPEPPGLLIFKWVLASVYVTAPLGTTVLGWIAMLQIRRSAGKLYGLRLAVFDGMLFPLLALDYGIAWFLFELGIALHFWTHNYDPHPTPF